MYLREHFKSIESDKFNFATIFMHTIKFSHQDFDDDDDDDDEKIALP